MDPRFVREGKSLRQWLPSAALPVLIEALRAQELEFGPSTEPNRVPDKAIDLVGWAVWRVSGGVNAGGK